MQSQYKEGVNNLAVNDDQTLLAMSMKGSNDIRVFSLSNHSLFSEMAVL